MQLENCATLPIASDLNSLSHNIDQRARGCYYDQSKRDRKLLVLTHTAWQLLVSSRFRRFTQGHNALQQKVFAIRSETLEGELVHIGGSVGQQEGSQCSVPAIELAPEHQQQLAPVSLQ